MDWNTAVGTAAAFVTTASNLPQLKKCWDTGSAGDLPLRSLSILALGLVLWTSYGVMREDPVIMVANVVSLTLLGGILYFKLREVFGMN